MITGASKRAAAITATSASTAATFTALIAGIDRMRTTPEMRARLRELSCPETGDDYDRAVLALLDDFDELLWTVWLRGNYEGNEGGSAGVN
jgi:hypothetical protein